MSFQTAWGWEKTQAGLFFTQFITTGHVYELIKKIKCVLPDYQAKFLTRMMRQRQVWNFKSCQPSFFSEVIKSRLTTSLCISFPYCFSGSIAFTIKKIIICAPLIQAHSNSFPQGDTLSSIPRNLVLQFNRYTPGERENHVKKTRLFRSFCCRDF